MDNASIYQKKIEMMDQLRCRSLIAITSNMQLQVCDRYHKGNIRWLSCVNFLKPLKFFPHSYLKQNMHLLRDSYTLKIYDCKHFCIIVVPEMSKRKKKLTGHGRWYLTNDNYWTASIPVCLRCLLIVMLICFYS